MDSRVDVLIICALKDEFDQLLQVESGLNQHGWQYQTDSSGWQFAVASFSSFSDSSFTVCATWAPTMGREFAQALASKFLQTKHINCIAMCGICAGRRGSVNLGDVIFADRLWSYDAGKLTVTNDTKSFSGDTVQSHTPMVWIQRMQNISIPPLENWLSLRPKHSLDHQEQWAVVTMSKGILPHHHEDFFETCPNWSAVLERLKKRNWVDDNLELTACGKEQAKKLTQEFPKGLPDPETFKIHVAPIATGAAVIEDKNLFFQFDSSMRKTLGVDMEASALAALANINEVPILVAKGVSDFGDTFKDDQYRNFAARASAECLIMLLRNSNDLFINNDSLAEKAPLSMVSLELPGELIGFLAEEYPDVAEARSLWERAGGRRSEVENFSRPKDLWQKIWKRSMQGASVSPSELLGTALEDTPNNPILRKYFSKYNK